MSAPFWSVAVFGRNEAPTLGSCLAALAAAGRGINLEVAVMLNGCTDDSTLVARRAMERLGLHGLVCSIPFADKSNAINAWLHDLAPAADTYVCVDAYAMVAPDALQQLGAALADLGVQAARQGVEHRLDAGPAGGLSDLRIGGVRSRQGDVVTDGAVEQVRVLCHQRGERASLIDGDPVDRRAVHEDPSSIGFDEPHQE